jgi:Fe-S cluster biogenesis protein NfuA
MHDKIAEILDRLRIALKAEGADLELLEISGDGVVKIRMKGLCGMCHASRWTHRLRIERTVKEKFPDATVEVLL